MTGHLTGVHREIISMLQVFHSHPRRTEVQPYFQEGSAHLPDDLPATSPDWLSVDHNRQHAPPIPALVAQRLLKPQLEATCATMLRVTVVRPEDAWSIALILLPNESKHHLTSHSSL